MHPEQRCVQSGFVAGVQLGFGWAPGTACDITYFLNEQRIYKFFHNLTWLAVFV